MSNLLPEWHSKGAPLAIHDPNGYDYGEQDYDDQDGLTASDPKCRETAQ